MATADDSIRGDRPVDLEGLVNPSDPKLRQKVIYSGPEPLGQPYLIVTEDSVACVGDEKNVVSVNPDYGINLAGRIALAAMPDQISIGGGYWRINPLVLSCIPSTSVTPVPWLMKAEPRITKAQDTVNSSVTDMESFSDIPTGI